MQALVGYPSLGQGPLYKRIKTLLTNSLAEGQWQPNESIPSEARLAEQFKVSAGTVRKAIDELVAEKILIRQQGRGTFVAAHSAARSLYYFFHIVGEDGVKRSPTPELISFEHGRADSGIAARLQIKPSAAIIRICNLLKLEDQPIEVDEIVVSAADFPNLSRKHLAHRTGTIYQLFQEQFGINIVHTAEHLRAVAANATDSKLLGVAPGSPILEIDRLSYTYHGRPVEARTCRVNTTQHVYFNDLSKAP